MREVIVYESSDGIKFCTKRYCMEYEQVLKKCKQIESLLPIPNKTILINCYIIHDREKVKIARNLYNQLVKKMIPRYMLWAEDNGQIIKFRNDSDKIVQREGFSCFLKLMYRFERIDKWGREFKLKEFVKHPNGLKGFKGIRAK